MVKELIQNELNTTNLEIELHKILSGTSREIIQNEYEILEQKLGGKGASEKTANFIISSIKN